MVRNIMSYSKLTSKGQITIPKKVRDRLNLRAGDRVNFAVHDDEVIMTPATKDITELSGIVDYQGPTISLEEMQTAISSSVLEK
ncbi:MAG: AbrB/MazE/SpoVT family DNA-binding domain-containing protein [Gammaproteobacteria bacterium]|nr:AbrB/MazE/SpoVT family DNA-binding domain-containing protein [Gammaproteobacteria bacterium]